MAPLTGGGALPNTRYPLQLRPGSHFYPLRRSLTRGLAQPAVAAAMSRKLGETTSRRERLRHALDSAAAPPEHIGPRAITLRAARQEQLLHSSTKKGLVPKDPARFRCRGWLGKTSSG